MNIIGTSWKHYMTIILSPDSINSGQYYAVKKEDILGLVYIYASKCQNSGFPLTKALQKTFCEISLFSQHYFNHCDHCYHYHCQYHHHYHHHSRYYHFDRCYHYNCDCYHYNDYHRYYHYYHNYHYYHCYHFYH